VLVVCVSPYWYIRGGDSTTPYQALPTRESAKLFLRVCLKRAIPLFLWHKQDTLPDRPNGRPLDLLPDSSWRSQSICMVVHRGSLIEATMILRLSRLRGFPSIFRNLTGITLTVFDRLLQQLRPTFDAQRRHRLHHPNRQRALVGGDTFDLEGGRPVPTHPLLVASLPHPRIPRLLVRRLRLHRQAGHAALAALERQASGGVYPRRPGRRRG
jgi:hypothetical protein